MSIGVYIHIPFCEKKCLYCDFASQVCKKDIINRYIDAIIKEINGLYIVESVDTIFIGGGTPTLLSVIDFGRIMDAISKQFELDIKEFTIEGNPNSVTLEKIKAYKRLGVTRISLGVQSFKDNLLQTIGRVHNRESALRAVKMCLESELDVNLDLMIGLPGQNIVDVRDDILEAINLGVGHISCYNLILEENTPMFSLVHSGKLQLPDEDLCVDMYDEAHELLENAGLLRYEISNFGKPCLHNIGYWNLKDYIGIGASAHSLYRKKRFYNTENIVNYIKGENKILEEVLSLKEEMNEYIMLALRMEKGIDNKHFIDKFGKIFFDKFMEKVDKVSGYLKIDKKNTAIARNYFYISNMLINDLTFD